MAKIFITGSADGLGHLAAKLLVSQGHHVVLHARNEARGREALAKLPGADKVLTADLSNIEETKRLAADVNAVGPFDAVIHNAGVYNLPARQDAREFQQAMININTLAPYILTCLIRKPKRLIYLSSGSHMGGDPSLKILNGPSKSAWISQTYSDTKLHDVILAFAVARHWPDVYANALDPGWVPTKMGGANAPDDLEKGFQTQTWLAVSNDEQAKVSGHYFYHQKQKRPLSAA
ncbi:MAG TPA: SDR family NAD(P)-dependent oxidoreductase, partial [Puia sp.]|nr:SDR family NAD(P)-dependent oxidoreductase [Puia sp.]